MVVSKKMFEDYETSIAAGKKLAQASDEERIVISGIAGSFPESADVEELKDNLLNKVDMITDDNRRWSVLHPEIPHRTGKIPNINKFDASFFGMHRQQANAMDVMCRVFLEKAYEAIIDAGMNPDELRGTKTGVFVGACYSESEKAWVYKLHNNTNGCAVSGCLRSMIANRVSYYFGLDGPSHSVDTACSSSMYAFESAYRSIREGVCDAAIVGGCNLCLTPEISLHFSRLGVLSLDGSCKCFDRDANGYCRSEAICAMLLQKKKDAKRIYATVVHAKTNCDGFKDEGITYPSGEIQQVLFNNFYSECEVDPLTLNYIEAHGTGTKVGDPEEVNAIFRTFCKGRKSPLKIGSIKSNLGHSEPTSGLCSITKVIIAMETGLIPPNINLKNLREDIKAFHDGSIKVITEVTPWEGGLAAANSFGFGGANCHVLLKWNEKSKVDGGIPTDDIPRLVNISGRTYKAVDKIIKKLEKMPLDVELCKLFHEIFKKNIQGYNYRGFVVLEKRDSKIPSKISQDKQIFDKKKPLCFYFPGLFTDCKLFDNSLFEIPAFSNTISLLSKTLKFDIFEVLSNSNRNGNDKIVNNFIAVTAVQIGMIDVFKSIGVIPDKIFGSSIGEIACAYADGCITAEEAILSSYYIALSLQELDFSPHVMVHIEMPCSEVQKMVLNEIEVSFVCPKTSTAVGPKSLIQELTNKLKKKSINVNLMNTFEKPMHSKSLKNAMKNMFMRLKQIIHSNKSSSSKWISCISSEKFDSDYFCTSILDALRFEGVTKYAEEAFVLEIGPSGTHHLSGLMSMKLFDENFKNYSSSLVASLGKLYVQGVDMDLSKLYPTVSLPVSRSTPMISPFLSWDHSEDWFVVSQDIEKKLYGERTFPIDMNDEEMEFISGHIIDGRNLYPATGYLGLVWGLVASQSRKHFSEVPVVFENVKFLRATTLSKERVVLLTVLVQKASGCFEVNEAGSVIVTGKVSIPDDISEEMSQLKSEKNVKSFPISSKDFYKELRLRGYNYKGLFKSVLKANVLECEGAIKWQENWVAFMDNMLQMSIILTDTRGLFVPTSLDRVVIDPKTHLKIVQTPEKEIPVVVYPDISLIKSGGIEIFGLNANAIPRKKNLGEPVLEKYHFVPNESNEQDIEQVVRIMVQTALENESAGFNIKVVEVPAESPILSPIIFQVLGDLPLIQPEITVLTNSNNPLVEGISPEIIVEDKKPSEGMAAMIVVASEVLSDRKETELRSCLNAIKDGGYLIAREKTSCAINSNLLQKIQLFTVNDEKIILLRKINEVKISSIDSAVIEVTRQNLNWLSKAQEAMKSKQYKRVYFVSQNDKLSGIIGLVNCVRKEPGGTKARCIFTFDENAPQFSLSSNFYSEQLKKDLSVNVYKNGKWGTYRHLQLGNAKEIKAEYIFANSLIRGDVSSMTWLQANEGELIKNKDRVVNIYYSALNFKDVMLSTGKLATESVVKDRLQQDCIIGFEFSGTTSNGKRIMGLAYSKALASKILPNDSLCWEVPDEWTLEDAATVPCVYLTVIYGILMNGNLKEGESILIHSGTGGIGQAAINIALSYGCTVFTTVGTEEKKRFLLQNFPQISEKNIGNSRDTSFEEMVMRETSGRGVDLVLNSLAEEKLIASVRCLAKNGRFIEIGKFDISNNSALGMELYKQGASFYSVHLDRHFHEKDEQTLQEKLGYELMKNELKRGSIKPLNRTVFKKEEIEQAFRYMAAGKHMGKILIKVNEEDERVPLAKAPLYNCKPRFYANASGSYIVTGGLGGFGLELADWLVLRGARTLILVSRKGVSNGYQDMRINIWKSYGVKVIVSTADITKAEGVLALLKEAESFAPVKGIFNLAVVLRDGIFGNQTCETFKDSIGPKADSTIYFDQYSRKMCPKLEHFVVFSSVSCGRGNGGQSNYGWSNSVMERVCESRREEGFPATAVQWGAIGDAGLVAEMQDEHIEIVIGGTLQQRINSCLEVLDGFLTQENAIVSSMVVAEKSLGSSSSDNIIETVSKIIGMKDLKNVSQHSTLAELGMDSMMAVEIKQTLERNFEVFLSPQEIRTLTFAKLWDLSTNKTEEPIQNIDSTPQTRPVFDFSLLVNIIGKEQTKEPMKLVCSSLDKSPGNQVFIAPGIEGEAGVFDVLSQLIESNVHVLQYSSKHKTVEDVSNFFFPKISSCLTGGSEFNLIGYSWGGLPILEVAHKLEKLKYTGKICLIDSSPYLMRGLQMLAGGEDEQGKSVVFRTVDILCPQERNNVETLLADKSDWNDIVSSFLNWSKTYVPHIPLDVLENIVNGIYYRLQSVPKFKDLPAKCLNSPILLLRPKEVSLSGEEDYGLSKYTNGTVTVKYCEGNHHTIIKQKSTAEEINSFMGFKDVGNKTPIPNGNSYILNN